MNPQYESVGKWISIIDRYGQIYLTQQCEKYGISATHIRFLILLFQRNGVSQDFLAQKFYVDKGTAARVIQKLEKIGFVERKPDTKDKRVNLVYLTQKAYLIESEIRSILYQWTEILTQNFSEEQKKELFVLLQKIADNAVHYIQTTKVEEKE